jgi:DNA repair protein RecO (recombination protein O)
MELRYNAIVLKKKEVGETDRLYTLYTLEQGKVQLVAKGVRKSEAKLAGQLETLIQGLVIAVKGNGMGKIAGAVAEKNVSYLRSDADILKRVLETVNVFERLVGWDEPDAELFNLLAIYLALSDDLAKEKQAEKAMLLAEGFLFQLFARLGYAIETGACVVSGNKLRSGQRHFFSPSAGGVLAGEHIHNAHNAFPVSESAIKLMRIFLSNKLESLSRVRVNEKEFREVRQASSLFFEWIKA